MGILFALLLATADGAQSEYALSLDAAADWTIARGQAAATGARTVDVGGRFTVYLTPVIEDATPIALQPYLQRRSSVTLTVGAATIATDADERRVHADLASEVYLTKWLALAASIGYRAEVLDTTQSRRDLLFYSALAEARLADVRLSLGIDGATLFNPAGADPLTTLRGRAELRAVLVEHIDLAIGGSISVPGGDGYLHIDYYRTRTLGFMSGVFGGKEQVGFPDWGATAVLNGHEPIPGNADSFIGFLMGFSYWPDPSIGVKVYYAPAWISNSSTGISDQRVILTLMGRAF